MSEDKSIGQLILRAAEGDSSAREGLLRHHENRLKRMVASRMDRRLKARFDPSDVVQEALITANQRLPDYLRDQPIAFYPWLRRITFEHLLKHHERHMEVQKRSVERESPATIGLNDESVHLLAERIAASISSPSAQMVRQEMNRRVREALASLKEIDREVIELLYLERLEPGEAAEVLEVTPQVIWTRHLRAIRRLTKKLQQEG
jgi:RNA polymerase sigma-70 factor (ECF subfamily)